MAVREWVSPQASSICGTVSLASRLAISARSGMSKLLTGGGNTAQVCMSVTKLLLRS